MLQLELNWPLGITLLELRPWLLDQIRKHGHPIRWAITSLKPSTIDSVVCLLSVEVVVINPQKLKIDH